MSRQPLPPNRDPSAASARPSADDRPLRFFIRTFGCQMNEYDSAKIADILRAEHPGAAAADRPENADLVLFNTCSVRDKAQEKVFSDLGRVRKIKAANPRALVAVGGCVASQEGENIVRRAPHVDLVFGPQTLHRLPEMIARRRETGRPQVDVSFPEIEKFDRLPVPRADGPLAAVSVMEGCGKFCSFCIVPYTRGREVSRPLADVLSEVAALASGGAREITLLGQNVNGWREPAGAGDFADLLECVARVPGAERVRFTTSHPIEFTDRLADAFAKVQSVASHLHLPPQSGSDKILAAMKRGHTALEYKSAIRKLRRARPDAAVSGDFIVGFPGESERDFQKTLDLADAVAFDFAYAFIYSPRPGTPAASFPDDTPLEEKKERLARLQEKLNADGKRLGAEMVGKTMRVLAEGPARRGGFWSGKASNSRPVVFPGPAEAGKFYDVKIAEVIAGRTLRGERILQSGERVAHSGDGASTSGGFTRPAAPAAGRGIPPLQRRAELRRSGVEPPTGTIHPRLIKTDAGASESCVPTLERRDEYLKGPERRDERDEQPS